MQKKIVRIITRLNIGGPAQNAIFLSEGLNDHGFETLLITGKPKKSEGDMSYLLLNRKISLRIINELSREINPLKDLMAFLKIFMIFIREKPEIIHTHTAKAGAVGRTAGIIYKFLLDPKVLIFHTFHGHVLEGYFSNWKTKFFLFIERLLASFTNNIISVSSAVKGDLLKYKIGDANKNIIIPLGLELDKFLEIKTPCVNNGSNNTFRVGIVGRLVPIKNHLMFLNSAKLLLDKLSSPDIKFIIVGDGEQKTSLEQYSKALGLEKNVEFTGWRKDIEQDYSNFDVVCLTSINEGTPVSLIEAMASARAIVATDVGGVGDILKPVCRRISLTEEKVLIKTGDAEGFANALYFLLENPQIRHRIGEAGREFVRENFTKERLIKDILILYNTLEQKQKITLK